MHVKRFKYKCNYIVYVNNPNLYGKDQIYVKKRKKNVITDQPRKGYYWVNPNSCNNGNILNRRLCITAIKREENFFIRI